MADDPGRAGALHPRRARRHPVLAAGQPVRDRRGTRPAPQGPRRAGRRLASIPEMREQETAALRRRYADPRARWFPAAITFLVPAAIANGGRCLMPPRRRSNPVRPERRGGSRQPRRPIAEQHAEWVGLLRPDGPFIAIPVLTEAFPQGLDTVPDDTLDKLRQAWAEVQEAPDLLTPAWYDLVLTELLGYTPASARRGRRAARRPAHRPGGRAPGRGRLRPRRRRAAGPNGCCIYRLPSASPDDGDQAPASAGRAGRGPVPPPRRPAGAAHQRRAVGPGARPARRARHDRGLRRRPVAGGARPAARLRQPAGRPPGAAAAAERRRRAQHAAWPRCSPAAPRPRPRSPTPSAPRSARRSNCWSASCPG